MRLATLLRATWAWAVLPAAALLTILYLGSDGAPVGTYALADQLAALEAGVLVLPVVGLAGAAVGRRFAPALTGSRATRGVGPILLTHLGPAVAAGTLPVITALGVVAARAAAPQAPDPRLLGVWVLATCAFVLTGFALGLRLRLLVAGPLALALPYLLIGFPPAMEPLWLRHLTWVGSGCCLSGYTLDPRALAAMTCVYLALTVLAGMAVLRLLGRRASASLLVVPFLLVGVGVGAAHPLGASAQVARPGQPRCAPLAGIEVCLWPEDESVRPHLAGPMKRLAAASRRTGATLPARLTEQAEPTWPAVQVFLETGPSDQLTVEIARAVGEVLPARCTPDTAAANSPAARQMTAQDVRAAWWLNQIAGPGVAQEMLGAGPDADAAYRRLTSQPMPQQVAWLERTGAQLRACQDVRLPSLVQREGSPPHAPNPKHD